jgi:dienelactone hydrolase
MNTEELLDRKDNSKSAILFTLCLLVFIGAVVIAHFVQRDFGRIEVSNAYYDNYNGKRIRAKLFRPLPASKKNPLPAVVFIHGYQNNRESGDAYNIELARRGFVVLGIDALGRGNSDNPGDIDDADFDDTFGARSSIAYLKSLPFVNKKAIGIMGHSIGAKISYKVALGDPSIHAVILVGNAYDKNATLKKPKNMLMVIGEFDEFRDRFTGTKDIVKEWMKTEATRGAFPHENPEFGVTYGNFTEGTARRVFIVRISHVQESHSPSCIAEAVEWMKKSLNPPDALWRDAREQIWPVKEAMTLLAMLACLISIMPLCLMLLRTGFFSSIKGPPQSGYASPTKSYVQYSVVNGILMWLYIPLILTLFAVHKYVVRVDPVFPMVMVDAIVWWFVWINIFGLLIFRSWYKKRARTEGLTLYELGISYRQDRFSLDAARVGKTILLGLILFAFLYICEYLSELIFLVDFRFIYPLLSDLTLYRFLMFLLYFPFILFGFLVLTTFVHGQLRRPRKKSWLKTYIYWTRSSIVALIAPIFLFLLVQYIPLLSTGFIPFEGPGGLFVVFIIELFFIMLILTMVMILSTWFYQITGKIYLSAFISALIVTWLFASSQVIAPVPI